MEPEARKSHRRHDPDCDRRDCDHPDHGHDRSDVRKIKEKLARIESSVGRIEKSAGLSQRAMERVERVIMGLQEQLTDVGKKFDDVTTSLGSTVQTGVDRILAEIAKQGTVTPEVQAAADHLSNAATALEMLNAASLDAFTKAGIPDVPPIPDPIPDPEPLPEVDPPVEPPIDPVLGRRR